MLGNMLKGRESRDEFTEPFYLIDFVIFALLVILFDTMLKK